MKQEIEKIFQRWTEEIFPNIGDGVNYVNKEEVICDIINLFPKWRVPNVDGWPEIGTHCLISSCLNNEICSALYQSDEQFFDGTWTYLNNHVVKWLPISEFLKIMEVNK